MMGGAFDRIINGDARGERPGIDQITGEITPKVNAAYTPALISLLGQFLRSRILVVCCNT